MKVFAIFLILMLGFIASETLFFVQGLPILQSLVFIYFHMIFPSFVAQITTFTFTHSLFIEQRVVLLNFPQFNVDKRYSITRIFILLPKSRCKNSKNKRKRHHLVSSTTKTHTRCCSIFCSEHQEQELKQCSHQFCFSVMCVCARSPNVEEFFGNGFCNNCSPTASMDLFIASFLISETNFLNTQSTSQCESW